MNKNIPEAIKEWTLRHREEYLNDLASLIAIPSVSEELYEASEEYPFGTRCAAVLDRMLDLCRQYGFTVRKIGNVIGIAEYGSGPRALDVVAHLDVQPAGPGWRTPPFELTIEGETAYGRGTSDDKGPALAALYALRALKESGVSLGRTVRLVFGTGEEYAISDIHYYTEAEEPAPFMFTPDHLYPVVNAKKAGYTATLSRKITFDGEAGSLLSVSGGDNRGAVPGTCEVLLCDIPLGALKQAAAEYSGRTGMPLHIETAGDGLIRVRSEGVSTHAVNADKGCSAVTGLLDFLHGLPLLENALLQAVRGFSALFPHNDFYGKEGGIFTEDAASGSSLYNVGIFRADAEGIEAKMRAVLPATAEEEPYRAFFRKAAEAHGLSVSEERFSAGHMIPLDDPDVQKLLRAYEAVTGEKAHGIAAGGGDYADFFPKGVAFGCEMPGVDTRMHGAQEFVRIPDMMMSIEIFACAIREICRRERD